MMIIPLSSNTHPITNRIIKNAVMHNLSLRVITLSIFPLIAPTAVTLLNAITIAPITINISPVPIFQPSILL